MSSGKPITEPGIAGSGSAPIGKPDADAAAAAASVDLPLQVDETGKYRPLRGAVGLLVSALIISITLLGAGWALELQRFSPVPVFKEQFLALVMTLSLVAIFLGVKTSRSESGGSIPWHDWIGAALGLITGGYVTVFYRDLVFDMGTLSPERYVLGAIAVLLVIEATRRMTGWTLIVLAVIALTYAKFSHLAPGLLNVPSPAWERLAIYLYLDSNGMLGTPLAVTATIIIPFILFGRVLYAVKGDQALTDFALVTMGRLRGGPAKVAVIASTLFGTVSGSAVSNVVMDGPITIPMMKRAGYPAHLAAAIESVASTGGQIMPPVMGITAFLIADFLQISYAEVVLAAIVPALLYYIALFIQIDLEAARRGIKGLPVESLPTWGVVLRTGWVFAVPITLLLYTLVWEGWQPQESAMLAVGATILVGFVRAETRPTVSGLIDALYHTGRTILDLAAITLIAGIVIGALQISGLSFNFSLLLLEIAGNSKLLLLFLTAIVCIILGMGMPTGIIYVMLAVLVGPALAEMGVVPIAAHLFLFYFGMMSMVTPPVALATFAAASIAQSDLWKSGWAGVRLGIVAYVVPFVMVYQPGLVLVGSAFEIVAAIGSCVIGVFMLSYGAVGYAVGPLGPIARVVMFAAGAAIMLTPVTGAVLNISILSGALIAGIVAALAGGRRAATA
jgi:TRAP transporter 4TM/12TM fusion protein